MWPSVWQLWQLIQPSCESLALVKSRSPRSAAVGSGRGPSAIVAGRWPVAIATTEIVSSSESAT